MSKAMWLCLKYKRLQKVENASPESFFTAQEALNAFLIECHKTKVDYDAIYQYINFSDAIVED